MESYENFVAKHDKLIRYMGMSIEKATPQFARVSMPLTENHKNGMGAAHGGAIFAIADVAFGVAANAERKTGVVSLSATIEYIRPGKTGPIVAEARAVRLGGHVVSYDVQVFDGSGSMIARTMASGYVTSLPLPL